MSEKWTKGPWRVGPTDDTAVTAADGSDVAMIDGAYDDPDQWPVMEANARLISAAPDMAEALNELADAFRAYLAVMDDDDIATLEKARAALAKARGQS